MVERIEGGVQLLLTPKEAELFAEQAAAQASADVGKDAAAYQNEPHDGEQCSVCSMFVPGFPEDVGGYCSKVQSFRGPGGMIFEDGWCKFFDPADDLSDLDDPLPIEK